MRVPNQARPELRVGAFAILGVLLVAIESALEAAGLPQFSLLGVAIVFAAFEMPAWTGTILIAFVASFADVASGGPRGLALGASLQAHALVRIFSSRRGKPAPSGVILSVGAVVAIAGVLRDAMASLVGEPRAGLAACLGSALVSMVWAWPTYRVLDAVDVWFRGRDDGFRSFS